MFSPRMLLACSAVLLCGGFLQPPPATSGWAPLMRAGQVFNEGESQPGSVFRTGLPYGVAAGDFNGDGLPDIATTNTAGNGSFAAGTTVSVLLHSTAPNYPVLFQPWTNYTVPENPNQVAAADMNLDGKADLIVSSAGINRSHTVAVLISTGQSFRPAKVYSLPGLFGAFVLAGDLNGDGRPDVVSQDSVGVAVLLNVNGDSLGAPAHYAPGAFPVSIADATGDGIPDLVTLRNVGGMTISIFPGNNTGAFGAPITISDPLGFDCLVVTSINGDSFPDLVCNAGGVRIYRGAGGGTFQAPVTVAIGIESARIGVDDLDGDGDKDIVATSVADRDIANSIAVVRNNGNGTFSAAAYPGLDENGETVLVDVDLDGRPDLVSPTYDGSNLTSHTVGVLLNDGAGGFAAGRYSTLSRVTIREAVADFNRDGNPDVLAVDSLKVSFGLGNGDGTFAPPTLAFSIGSSTSFASTLVAGDVDRDSKMDVLVQLGSQFQAYRGGGGGTFAPYNAAVSGALFRRSFTAKGPNGLPMIVAGGSGTLTAYRATLPYTVGTPQTETVGLGGICFGDYNRDGTQDVALAGNGGLSIFLVSPVTGDLTPESLVLTGRSYSDVCTGYFNRDGVLDLAAREINTTTEMSLSRGVDVFLGFGNGTFAPPRSFGTVEQYSGPTIDTWDANRDGLLDIVTSGLNPESHRTGPVEVDLLLGNGAGDFGLRTSYALGVMTQPFVPIRPITIGDVDRNGVPDLLTGVYTPTDFTNPIHLQTILASPPIRPAGLAPTEFYPAFNNPRRVALGDLNRDGLLDLVDARAGALPAIEVRLGNGFGSFLPTTSVSQAWYSSSVALGDLNRDGILDIVGSNSTNGPTRVSSYLGIGDGTFGPRIDFFINAGNDLEIGDMNRDGIPDVVTASQDSIQVLIGSGNGHFTAFSRAFVGPCYDLDLADINRDGRLDVVVAGGTVSILYTVDDSGALAAPVTVPAFISNCRTLCVTDFNRDGFPDILATEGSDYYVFWGAASSPYSTSTLSILPYTALDVETGEAQADGVPFVYISHDPERVELLSVGPAGTLTGIDNEQVYTTPENMALGDIDGDGIVDVATACSGSSLVTVTRHGFGLVSGVAEVPRVASRAMLAQNIPNPFNPSTEIRFQLAAADEARLDVYDVHGRLVRALREGHFNAGEYRTRWDGTDQQGHHVGSGVFFYELTTRSGIREGRRMILLK